MYTVSQKTVPTYFCSLSVKYEPISIKIGRSVTSVPEQTRNKTVPELPTSPKVCACTTLENFNAIIKCTFE